MPKTDCRFKSCRLIHGSCSACNLNSRLFLCAQILSSASDGNTFRSLPRSLFDMKIMDETELATIVIGTDSCSYGVPTVIAVELTALRAVVEAAEKNNRKPSSEHFLVVCRALAALDKLRATK